MLKINPVFWGENNCQNCQNCQIFDFSWTGGSISLLLSTIHGLFYYVGFQLFTMYAAVGSGQQAQW